MSLFAHSYEYQRSFERIWEDFSAPSRAQTEPTPDEPRAKRHQSALNPEEVFMQNEAHNAVKSGAASGSELMQYDAKAWGRFLDSKRNG